MPISIPLTPYGRREILLYGAGSLLALLLLPIVATATHLYWLTILDLPFLALFVFTIQFFRDPERAPAPGATAGDLLSPADGTVVDVVEVDEPEFVGGRARRIGVFMSPLNCHVNRFPCDGVVEKVLHRAGKFLAAYDPRAIVENECSLTGIRARLEGGGEARLLLRQVSGVAARRIVNPLALGAPAVRGQRFGMIKFGSRCELYLPIDAPFEVAVKVGDRTYAGHTILARPAKVPVAGGSPVAGARS